MITVGPLMKVMFLVVCVCMSVCLSSWRSHVDIPNVALYFNTDPPSPLALVPPDARLGPLDMEQWNPQPYP